MAKNKVLAAAWVAADTGGAALVSLLSILFIARLLGPKDFGRNR